MTDRATVRLFVPCRARALARREARCQQAAAPDGLNLHPSRPVQPERSGRLAGSGWHSDLARLRQVGGNEFPRLGDDFSASQSTLCACRRVSIGSRRGIRGRAMRQCSIGSWAWKWRRGAIQASGWEARVAEAVPLSLPLSLSVSPSLPLSVCCLSVWLRWSS